MALTLEATLVIPMTMTIMIGVLSASIVLYDRIETDARVEARSFLYAQEHREIWSCDVDEHSEYDQSGIAWSKRISVNPVREKDLLMLLVDTISEIKDLIPLLNEMEGTFFDPAK